MFRNITHSEDITLLNLRHYVAKSVCKLPHDVAFSDKAHLWSPAIFLTKFAPIVGSGHQHSMVDAVPFLSYPRHAGLERDLVNWVVKEVFDKLLVHINTCRMWTSIISLKIRPGYRKRNGSKTILRVPSTYRCAISVPLMTPKDYQTKWHPRP
ncbi:uncharacterized protein TNCV_4077441 [Trichonephila clavipes]|uniref:Uncharacterized protein n=1 Tax=Trichonephila clavipes TaxID=2585209 RepID=A0A8X6R7A1_TRICX|nr:uncharacterized protein TNCV_4077441 [Trichonephila clavipes]